MYYEANVTVTPGMAREFLSRNVENNRPPKRDRIQQYARDMASGRWNVHTPQTISFDTRKNLIDGQNRMHALVLANVALPFNIAHDVSVEVMPFLDSGAARTSGDALSVAVNGVNDRNRVASVARWSIMWDAGLPTGKGGSLKPTHAEIVERVRAEPGAYDAAARRGADVQRQGLANASVGGMAYYLFARLDAVRNAEFFDAALSGANLEPGSPILTLRNRLVKVRFDRLTRPEILALYVRGWNAWMRGEKPSQLIITKGPLTNENFPKPVVK